MPRLCPHANVVLIGFPGAGKSTIGLLLAERTQRRFLDTDVLLQAQHGQTLERIIAGLGREEFCRLEQRCILGLDVRNHVIATGGSVVYSPAAMEHLAAVGVIVHLLVPLEALLARVDDPTARGVVVGPGQSLTDLHRERQPLYERWAQWTVDCGGKTPDEAVEAILAGL